MGYVRQMQDLQSLPGYDRLRELADSIAFSAYTKWLAGGNTSEYCRGQIAGLESLFQNLSNSYDEMKEYVADIKSKLNVEEEDANTATS